jgi:hypothetical protein
VLWHIGDVNDYPSDAAGRWGVVLARERQAIDCARNCARGDPRRSNLDQRHAFSFDPQNGSIFLAVSDFGGNSPSAASVRKNRGWLCKTSIPGSNPGGASNFYCVTGF